MVIKIWLGLLIFLLLRLITVYYQLPVRETGQEINITGIIGREPSQVGMSQQLNLEGYTISTKLEPPWHFGDRVEIQGQLTCYDSLRCVRGRIKASRVDLIASKDVNPLLLMGAQIRTRIQGVYFDLLPRSQANLLAGVVLGSVGLDNKFKNELANVGLTHVVAASGMNITLFAGFVIAIFTGLHVRRRQLTLLAMLAIGLYTLVTGFEPAIVRAALMALAGLSAYLVGRKSSGFIAVLMAAYLMLWASPLLLFNFGFLLSFASMMGQITLSTISYKVPNWLAPVTDILAQTLVAIAFTFPIVLAGFSKFSLISMVSNLLVLWTVEPLMLLGGIAGIVGFWLPSLAKLLLISAGIVLSYFLWVVKSLSSERFLLKIENFNIFLVIAYYLFLTLIIYYLKHKSVYKAI